MDDLISRQAAIDALDKRFDSIPMEQTVEVLQLRRDLRELPPAQPEIMYYPQVDGVTASIIAQPEIIRCKDCLMHGVCRFEQGLGLDGYCSQAERREE